MTSGVEEIVDKVSYLLAQLGTDKDAVAASLRSHGIAGLVDNVQHDQPKGRRQYSDVVGRQRSGKSLC